VSGSEMVLGGDKADPKASNFVVGLRQSEWGVNYCAGVLVSLRHVLTTAHCLSEDPQFVSIGSLYWKYTHDGERIRIAKKFVHKEYDQTTGANDFAVLELATYTQIGLAIDLIDPMDEVKAGETITIYGWGYTGDERLRGTAWKLQQLKMKVWTPTACNSVFENRKIHHSMFCAGGEEGKDTCHGDSGGPAIVMRNNKPRLAGVISYSDDNCGELGIPAVFMKLSHTWNLLFERVPYVNVEHLVPSRS
jgi:secreted trypsin-like serine protease